ncbi:1,3-beta-glucanosyltransferase gas1 [Fusarium chlamydosporum]
MSPIKNIVWALFVAADLAAAHSVIINAVGDAGGSGMALGVDTSTPRDGTRRRPFQTDATRFRGNSADTVGETLAGGDNQVEQGTLDIMEETGDQLPQVNPGGSVEMTVHQVNSDGAGPYTCMINADGTGNTWENIPVTTNVEGNDRGRNRDGEMGDFPLVASIPTGQTCTGSVAGEDNNPARAGPFGGVVPVQLAQPTGNTAGNGTESNTGGNAGSNTGNDAVNNADGNAGSNTGSTAGNTATNGKDTGDDEDEQEEDEDDNGTGNRNNRNNRRATRFFA